ncbi:MAG: hypothetical protein OT477_14900 [Chloroflexi bacterium]|nr:hypothetical protein [Chloroflexota bacterium]
MFVNRVRLSLYVGVGLLVGLGLGLASAAWLVGARPTAAQTAELETAAPFDPGTPAPEGYYIAYAFAGVTDHEEVATVVHCSNPTSATADVILELYSADLADSYSHDFAIFSQRNETIATRAQIFFHETQVLDTGFIQQGFGRILVEEGRQIICIAQLVEKDVERPSFIVNLDMVTPQTSPLGNNVTIPGTAPEGYSLQYMLTGFMHFNNLLNNMFGWKWMNLRGTLPRIRLKRRFSAAVLRPWPALKRSSTKPRKSIATGCPPHAKGICVSMLKMAMAPSFAMPNC